MRGLREIVTWVGAAGLVAAVSFLPAWQSAQSQDAGEVVPRDERPIVQKRAKFFELFVNSMDLFGEGRAVSCFDYQCKGLIATACGIDDQYQLVRTVHVGMQVFPSPCDETLACLGINPGNLVARKVQTRWMRNIGPAGTPVGCFDGVLSIGVRVSETATVEIFRAVLLGTTGLRPAMADPLINMVDPQSDARCNRPLHDEGCYIGRFNARGLKRAQQFLNVDLDSRELKRFLKEYGRCVVQGTFEGSIEVDPDDYCTLTYGQWWYDGLMKCKCRRPNSLQSRTPVLDGPLRAK